MYYVSSSGRIELQITAQQAAKGAHIGQCSADVHALSQVPKIARQLRKIDPAVLRRELQEFGCWGDDELMIHEDNLLRILWIACGDILESKGI